MHARIAHHNERQHGDGRRLRRRRGELRLARERCLCRPLGLGAQRPQRLGAQRGDPAGPGMPGGEVLVRRDRLVVAAGLLLTGSHDERPEHVGGLEQLRGARDHGGGVAPLGGGERGSEPEAEGGVVGLLLGLSDEIGNVGGRDAGGPGRAGARPGQDHQEERQLSLAHRRDFFFPGFFFGAPPVPALGFAPRTGLRLDARGPSTSSRRRSPSSGPIRPRRTA